MLRKIYILLILASVLQGQLYAQELSADTKAARKEYSSLKYAQAIKILEKELTKNPNNKDAQEMIADSYRRVRNYPKAAYWYEQLTKNTPLKPDWALRYAEVLGNNKEYAKSGEWYNKYLTLAGNDTRASNFSKFYPNVDELFVNSSEWKVNYLNINTNAAEYSPMYFKQGLAFTSNRRITGIVKRVFEWDQAPFTDMYYVGNLSEMKPVNVDSVKAALRQDLNPNGKRPYRGNNDYTGTSSNDTKVLGTYTLRLAKDTLADYLATQIKLNKMPGKINTKYHDGPAALLPDGSIMFTRNNYDHGKYGTSKDGINKLKLFTAKAPDLKEIVPFAYNNDEYSVGDPAINTKGTLLIFASDMPGGKGGVDLYYCKRNSAEEEWSKPINMGSVINTEGNELKPTFLKDNLLSFASTGHAGLGGLDVFQVTLDDKTNPTAVPVNMGSPINSSFDDFGLIRSQDGATGYFSSNRGGSDDVYSFFYHPIRIALHGIVLDSLSNEPILSSQVTIEPDISLQVKDNQFDAVLKKETDYLITATTAGYRTVQGRVSTKGIVSDTLINVILKPGKIPVIIPFNCDSVKQTLAVNNIYYNLNKAAVRPDAQETMARLVSILTSNPRLKLNIASYCDSRGTSSYNLDLSKRRSQSAMNYLVKKGISKERIRIEYFGETNLVNNCANGVRCSEANQQLNRRSEFFITLDGNKVLSMDCDWIEKAFSEL
ncbi:OmpA family protein [Pedobacter sp. MW01-1-1]|uniref:OmpA family protein n=1 Tax=Pedobacter sp. MW01-1-1 TaxID=3383027 RepID=UPI003FF1066C